MADYGFNTQLTPNIPQTSLSDMMNLARGAQAYQQAQQLNPLQLQALQQQVEQARQMNPLQLRQQGAATSLAEQTLEPSVQAAKAQASSATTKSSQDAFQFALLHANDAVQQLQTMVNDPDLNKEKITNFITKKIKETNGPPEAEKQALFGLPEKGTARDYQAFAAKKLAASMSVLSQLEKLYPASQMTTEGATMTPRQMGSPILTGQPAGMPAGPSIETTLSPGQTYEATGKTDVNGNPTAYVKDKSGKILGEVTIPAGVFAQPTTGKPTTTPNRPAAPPANAPLRIRQGESPVSYEQADQLRINARNAAQQTPMQQFTANQIIDLANKAQTGVGSETLANIAGRLAVVPWTGNAATYFDSLGHYMTLQQASLAKSAGLSGTDQANQLAGQLSGTTNWTEDAIKSTARVNRALSTATSMFNNGIENKLATTKDRLAPNDFQSQWSKTADINAIRLHDAIVNKDPAGIKEVIQSVDPQAAKLKNPMQSPNVQFLLKKWEAMDKLVKGQ